MIKVAKNRLIQLSRKSRLFYDHPALGEMAGDARIVLRPRVQLPVLRPAGHGLAGPWILHRDRIGTTGKQAKPEKEG